MKGRILFGCVVEVRLHRWEDSLRYRKNKSYNLESHFLDFVPDQRAC